MGSPSLRSPTNSSSKACRSGESVQFGSETVATNASDLSSVDPTVTSYSTYATPLNASPLDMPGAPGTDIKSPVAAPHKSKDALPPGCVVDELMDRLKDFPNPATGSKKMDASGRPK